MDHQFLKNKRILLVDDEPELLQMVQTILRQEGYTNVYPASCVREALETARQVHPEMAVLDVMLPDGDGFSLMKKLREQGDYPILFLTARDGVQDRIHGLELGADDYVVKPFEAKEVVARIKAVLRRFGKNGDDLVKEVHYDKLSINLTNYELKVDGKVVDTPPKEMELIYHLASNPNRVFTRDQLLDEVWGFDYYGDSRTVDVHVKRLREKLEGVSDKWALKTVWGVGYKFEVKE